jgi:hypothetical protein
LGSLSVAVLGVVGSMGTGMEVVGHSRQRSAGTAVAEERLERVRNVPYDRVALYEAPAHNATPGHPDNDVTTDNTGYRLEDGTVEKLVVDTTDDDTPAGALKHLDDPFTLEPEGTEFTVYQYVTWVEDASVGDQHPDIAGVQSYKRAIIVAIWKFPVYSSPNHRVVQSTFISDGTVAAPTAPPPTAPPSASPTTAPTATPGTVCGVVEALGGTGAHTNSTTVQIRLSRAAGCTPTRAELSNNSTTWVVVTQDLPQPVTVAWTIPSGDGPKTVYARFTDGPGNKTVASASLVLDTAAPSVPAALAKVSCPAFNGNSRTVTFGWQASTDPAVGGGTNLAGYRVYRSVDSGPFTAVTITSALTATNTDSKGYGLRFLVRAYDKAGNESGDSNVISYSKNSC